jgi:hypothetical protein
MTHRVGGGIGELVESLIGAEALDGARDGLTHAHPAEHAR